MAVTRTSFRRSSAVPVIDGDTERREQRPSAVQLHLAGVLRDELLADVRIPQMADRLETECAPCAVGDAGGPEVPGVLVLRELRVGRGRVRRRRAAPAGLDQQTGGQRVGSGDRDKGRAARLSVGGGKVKRRWT